MFDQESIGKTILGILSNPVASEITAIASFVVAVIQMKKGDASQHFKKVTGNSQCILSGRSGVLHL